MQRLSFRFSTLSSLAAAVALTTVAANTAMAGDVTFAQYDQVNGATEQWTITTSGNITTRFCHRQCILYFLGRKGV